MITINADKNIYYDETKTYDKQSDEFKAYATEKYYEKVVKQVTTEGYPPFNEDGSITFHIEDDLLSADVTRVQVKPFSKADRRVKETIIEITVK